MMNFIKKQSAGVWISLAVAILGIVAVILYGANGAEGYFKGRTSGGIVTMTIFAVILEAVAIALTQFKFDGVLGKTVKILCDALKIGAVLLLIASMLLFISDRAQGLAFILGSDEAAQDAARTPENLSSASSAIAGIVFYMLAWIVSVVAVFFSSKLKRVQE